MYVSYQKITMTCLKVWTFTHFEPGCEMWNRLKKVDFMFYKPVATSIIKCLYCTRNRSLIKHQHPAITKLTKYNFSDVWCITFVIKFTIITFMIVKSAKICGQLLSMSVFEVSAQSQTAVGICLEETSSTTRWCEQSQSLLTWEQRGFGLNTKGDELLQ